MEEGNKSVALAVLGVVSVVAIVSVVLLMTNSQTTAELSRVQFIKQVAQTGGSHGGCTSGFAVSIQCKNVLQSRGVRCTDYNPVIDAYCCSAQC